MRHGILCPLVNANNIRLPGKWVRDNLCSYGCIHLYDALYLKVICGAHYRWLWLFSSFFRCCTCQCHAGSGHVGNGRWHDQWSDVTSSPSRACCLYLTLYLQAGMVDECKVAFVAYLRDMLTYLTIRHSRGQLSYHYYQSLAKIQSFRCLHATLACGYLGYRFSRPLMLAGTHIHSWWHPTSHKLIDRIVYSWCACVQSE